MLHSISIRTSFSCLHPHIVLGPYIPLFPSSLSLLLHPPKTAIQDAYLQKQNADLLASLYDVGGIIGKRHCGCVVMVISSGSVITNTIGGITTGLISDLLGARAISCILMMYLAVPTVRLHMHTFVNISDGNEFATSRLLHCWVGEFLTFWCLAFEYSCSSIDHLGIIHLGWQLVSRD